MSTSLQVNKDSQMKGKDDSITWQTYATEKLVILESVIREIVQRKDQVPNQLLEVANTILSMLSAISSLKNHKKDFELLLGYVSTLVVVFWRSYNQVKTSKYHSLAWPPPKFRKPLNNLVNTVCCLQKLMGRKCEKNVIKRTLVGCFGIRDLRKFDKCQRELESVALDLESNPHNIDIYAVLLAVVNGRTQPHQEGDTELSEELIEGDLSVRESAKTKGADQPVAEGSSLLPAGKPTRAKPAANQTVEVEEDNQGENLKMDNAEREPVEEHSAEDKPVRTRKSQKTDKCKNFHEVREKQDRKKTIGYGYEDSKLNEADLEEGTSKQGTRTNHVAQSKTRKRLSQGYEDQGNKDMTPKRRKGRSRTTLVSLQTPAPPRHQQATISDFSFSNGAGIMINENIGNIYNSTMLNVPDDVLKRGKSPYLK